MIDYAICEIRGKQYKILPNQPFDINLQKKIGKSIEANVLLMLKDGKMMVGKPYLKEKISLRFVENKVGEKVRVNKFHAKANYRRSQGIRPKYSRVILDVKKTS